MDKESNLRETVAISKSNRVLINDFQSYDILGFSLASTTDIFLLAMSMGINDPKPLNRRDPYSRTSYFDTRDKALLETPSLARVSSDDEINEKANLEACLDSCEQYAESGFQKLNEEINSANWDREIFERRMMKQLDLLFTQYVENDLD